MPLKNNEKHDGYSEEGSCATDVGVVVSGLSSFSVNACIGVSYVSKNIRGLQLRFVRKSVGDLLHLNSKGTIFHNIPC